MATLINGNGNPAIYAQQDADFYNGIMGPRTRILNVGSKMAATIEDANTIAIADGVIITKEGRRVQVDVGNVDEFIIPTGQAGTTRYYIIGYHLYTDGSANQLCETFVQLMASGSETITEDEFREGATEVYVSLYRIEQTGLTLNDPEALLTVGDSVSQIEDDIDDIEGDIAQINSDLTELRVLLWTNPNPTVNFNVGSTITIEDDSFDHFEFISNYDIDRHLKYINIFYPTDTNTFTTGQIGDSKAMSMVARSYTISKSGDTIVLTAGSGYAGKTSVTPVATQAYSIPFAIYGIKLHSA